MKRIPIVILTTLQAEQGIAQAYSLHANCYFFKPADFEQFADVVRAIEHFWLTVVLLTTTETIQIKEYL